MSFVERSIDTSNKGLPMSEHWYVIPATLALRSAGQSERDAEQIEWRLPEAWGKSGEPVLAEVVEVGGGERLSIFGSR